MANANPLRARWRRALTAPLLVILGCSDLARGFPDASLDASADAPRADAVITDATDATAMDRATPTDQPEGLDAPASDSVDVSLA